MSLRTRYKSPVQELFCRPRVEESPKLIFVSCEGPVTEEMYFDIVSHIFEKVQDKIKIASARADFFATPPELRTQTDIDEQNRSEPRQVMERMDSYLSRHKYWDLPNNPADEFWLVLDVDHHTSAHEIEKWELVLHEAAAKHYQCAISNPFFEAWLLLHHDDPSEEDARYAVTQDQPYESTKHFIYRLEACGAPLSGKKKKDLEGEHYSEAKIMTAIQRAKALHQPQDVWPQTLGSTMYILLNQIVELLPRQT